MSYKYPKCISKGCPIQERCDRFVNGEESQLVDYDRVDVGKGKCEWLILVEEVIEVIDNGQEGTRETETVDAGTEIEDEK